MLYSEFLSCVNHFLEISNSIDDGWSLKTYKDKVYLVKSMTQCLKNGTGTTIKSNELADINLNLPPDEQAADDAPLIYRKWEYHVLYSYSYQVPVIYFNVWNSSGQLLSLDELWEAANPNFKESIFQNKWYTLTQQEHPYLFKPFFYFHPCHTKDFLNSFAEPSCNMLITWLSSIGQVVWLKLSSEYGKRCIFNKQDLKIES